MNMELDVRLKRWIVSLFMGMHMATHIQAVVDFYVDAEQTELLYGVKSDGIFYIQDGIVNHYAMTFQNQMIPPQVSSLIFHWKAKRPDVAYSIHIIHSPGPAMDRPVLNISSTGVVPMEDNSRFAVLFPCTGIAEGEIDFLLQIKFILNQRKTETLNFKRRKVCLVTPDPAVILPHEEVYPITIRDSTHSRGQNHEVGRDVNGPQPPIGHVDGASSSSDGGGRRVPPGSSTILVLGAVAGAVSLLSVLLTVMYVTRKKRIPPGSFASSTINLRTNEEFPNYSLSSNERQHKASTLNGLGTTGHQRLHAQSQPHYQLQRSRFGGSYATLASFTHVPVHAPMHVRSKQFYQDGGGWAPRSQEWHQFSPRWLEHYTGGGGHQPQLPPGSSSVWSSQTPSMNRPWRSGSQNTLLSQGHELNTAISPPTSSTATSGDGPGENQVGAQRQPNALVLENGMLRLCSQSERTSGSKRANPAMDGTGLPPTGDGLKPSRSRVSSPFYQNLPRPPLALAGPEGSLAGPGALSSLHRSHDSIYTDLLQPGIGEPYVMYTPQIYPHLMPQNFMQAQHRLPRSTSGGSVLV